jgi:antitoxin component YwqK of YwqJK toxin-antitoxin module
MIKKLASHKFCRTKKIYYKPGTVESRMQYRNGLLHGRKINYFPSGILWQNIPYKEGRINGIVRKYYEIGFIQQEISFADGLMHGINSWYYKSGIPSSIFLNNKDNCAYTNREYFYEDGTRKDYYVYTKTR